MRTLFRERGANACCVRKLTGLFEGAEIAGKSANLAGDFRWQGHRSALVEATGSVVQADVADLARPTDVFTANAALCAALAEA
jgi:hypothetical protein